jgi:hypothetical protein
MSVVATRIILRQVAKLLTSLTDDQIEDLADGRARLVYAPTGAAATLPAPRAARPPTTGGTKPKPDTVTVIDALTAARGPDERLAYLEALGARVTIPDLKRVAAELGITIPSKVNKGPLTERIARAPIGGPSRNEVMTRVRTQP